MQRVKIEGNHGGIIHLKVFRKSHFVKTENRTMSQRQLIAGPSVTLIAGNTFMANRSLQILSDISERKDREI